MAEPDRNARPIPPIIQGGMGIAVSGWRLARTVSQLGQLGVVSGTAIDSVLVRRLQDGDRDGSIRRALATFPMPEMVQSVMKRYFLPEGRAPGAPYALLPMYRQVVSRAREAVTVLAGYVEVFLAREGHDGLIGINLLTKVQMPNMATLFGAMLAGVDVVLMGAGIPREIPAVLHDLAANRPASIRFEVSGPAGSEPDLLHFDPRPYLPEGHPALRIPRFLPIVASNSLATMMARKTTPPVDGFVIEGPTAGGHNAPPRGAQQLNARGEPIYGERDVVDLDQLAELGLPFWLAGGEGTPARYREARAAGASGIQVGTLFAFCEESGLDPELRGSVLAESDQGTVDVLTDPRASPTGYPFKVVSWDNAPTVPGRKRVCDLGYLRTAHRGEDGRIRYRCPAEPVEDFVRKGGAIEETEGRRCLCNALMANIALGQEREGYVEPPVLTSGDDLTRIAEFLGGRERYSAADVVDYLLDRRPAAQLQVAATAP